MDNTSNIKKDSENINESLIKQGAEIEEANTRLEEFAYVVSHDLRAPLRSIDNLVEWIEEESGDTLNDKAREYFGLLKGRVNRMNYLIEGILQFSRVGRKNCEISEVDVISIVDDVVESLGVPDSFNIDVPKSMPMARTSSVLLTQVVANLISNAIEHHDKPGGAIKLICHDEDSFLRFDIIDDGPGIDDAYKEKVFGVFQTLQSRDEKETSGMGLAIAKKAVHWMGGEINVKDNHPRGSIFYFTIKKQME